jgi:predicted phosphodiesterase
MSLDQLAVVMNDIHLPFADAAALELALQFTESLNPNVVVLNGDICDFYSLSAYDKNPLTKASLKDEIAQVRALLKRLEPMPKKHFLQGNHEFRLTRYLWRQARELAELSELSFPQLVGLADFGFTHREYGDVLNLGKLQVVHGSIARKKAGESVRAHMEQMGGSVLIGHTHRGAQIFRCDYQGYHTGVENFCLCRLDPEYVVGKPDWAHGLSVVSFSPKTGLFHVELVPILRDGRGRPFLVYGGEVVYARKRKA